MLLVMQTIVIIGMFKVVPESKFKPIDDPLIWSFTCCTLICNESIKTGSNSQFIGWELNLECYLDPVPNSKPKPKPNPNQNGGKYYSLKYYSYERIITYPTVVSSYILMPIVFCGTTRTLSTLCLSPYVTETFFACHSVPWHKGIHPLNYALSKTQLAPWSCQKEIHFWSRNG